MGAKKMQWHGWVMAPHPSRRRHKTQSSARHSWPRSRSASRMLVLLPQLNAALHIINNCFVHRSIKSLFIKRPFTFSKIPGLPHCCMLGDGWSLAELLTLVLSGDLLCLCLAAFRLVPDKKLKNWNRKNLDLWIYKPHEHQLVRLSREDIHQNTGTIMELEQKTSRWLSCLAVSTIWFIITFKWIEKKSKKTTMDGQLSHFLTSDT